MKRLLFGCIGRTPLLHDLEFAIQNGFEALEIGLDGTTQDFATKNKQRNEIRERAASAGVLLSTHLPWCLPTCCGIPEIQHAVIKIASKSILFSENVNASKISIHPGFRETSRSESHKSFPTIIETLTKIVDFGKEHNVTVCLENNDKSEYLAFFSAEDHLKILNAVEGLYATFDVGHAATTGSSTDAYYKHIQKYVRNVHLHDNDGQIDEHKCIGDGQIDFLSLVKEFKAGGYNGPFIFELSHQIVSEGKQRFLKIWNSMPP